METKNKFYNSLIVKFGFLLHENFSIHSLVLFILNILSAIAITGLFNFLKQPLIAYRISSFILFILVATLLELVVKTFVLRYFINIIFKTFGGITILIQAILFYATTFIVNNFNFNQISIISVFVFTISFLIIRLLIISIYQKYILKYLVKKE